jgi:hypothetical protein
MKMSGFKLTLWLRLRLGLITHGKEERRVNEMEMEEGIWKIKDGREKGSFYRMERDDDGYCRHDDSRHLPKPEEQKIPRMIYIRQYIHDSKKLSIIISTYLVSAMHCVLLSALGFRASPAALGFWRRDSGLLIDQLPSQF